MTDFNSSVAGLKQSLMARSVDTTHTASQLAGEVLDLVSVNSHMATRRNPDGTYEDGERVILSLLRGEKKEPVSVGFMSMAASQFAREIIDAIGEGPWEGTIPIKWEIIKTASKFNTYRFTIL